LTIITTPEIHRALDFFVEHLPPNLHLVMVTREDPPLSLARLRARGQLTEIRSEDLTFSKAETDEFLNQTMSLELDAEDAGALSERTEGWIAGLRLARMWRSTKTWPAWSSSPAQRQQTRTSDILKTWPIPPCLNSLSRPSETATLRS
jgi:ATP/maltotriose-dependent transcriptional regulator MalT